MRKSIFPYRLFLRLSFVIPFLALAVLLNISCDNNGQSSNIVGPEGGTVRSADRRLTLNIPPGALTEDTEIIIVRLPGDQAARGLVAVPSYELMPDGLEFLLPVTASLEVDIETAIEEGDVIADLSNLTLINISGDTSAPLDNQFQTTNLDDNITTVTGELNHFSRILVTDEFPDTTLPNIGAPMLIGIFTIPCEVDATIANDRIRFTQQIRGPNETSFELLQEDLAMIKNIDRTFEFETEPPLTITEEDPEFPPNSFDAADDPQFEFTKRFIHGCARIEGTATFKLKVTTTLEVETAPGVSDFFVFEQEVEKEIECKRFEDPVTPPTDPPPPTFPPEVSIDTGGDFNFTHVCNQTPCPQELGTIVFTNNSRINSADLFIFSTRQTPGDATVGFIQAPTPQEVTNEDLSISVESFELGPGETVTFVVFYRCTETESFTDTIFIDALPKDQNGMAIPDSLISETRMVNATLTKPTSQFPLEPGTYSGSGNCLFGQADLSNDGDDLIIDPLGVNPNAVFNPVAFDAGGSPTQWQSESSDLIVLNAGGHGC